MHLEVQVAASFAGLQFTQNTLPTPVISSNVIIEEISNSMLNSAKENQHISEHIMQENCVSMDTSIVAMTEIMMFLLLSRTMLK